MMFFRSKVIRKPAVVEPTFTSATSLEEMSELLKQAVGIIEGLRAKCDAAEHERDAAGADLALAISTVTKLEASNKEKDQLLSDALDIAARNKEELEAFKLDSAEFEAATYEEIELLQAELDDIEKTATLRWGSLARKASTDPSSDVEILDLLHPSDGSPLIARLAA